MAILNPLTKITLKAGKAAADALSEINKLGKKNQTLNVQKKEVIQSYHKFFVRENSRLPQKNEFDRLLSGKGINYDAKGHRYTKTKTLIEGLEFGSPQNVTYENFLVKQARGKAKNGVPTWI